MANLGVLGGSFDPVHNAHIAMAQQAMDEFDLDSVIFVPAYLPPHKEDLKVSAEDRTKMLYLGLENKRNFFVDKFEINSKRVIYAYQTLNYLQNEHPNDKIKLIIGSDSFNRLDTWKESEYIGMRYGFIVMRRPNDEISPQSIYFKYALVSKSVMENISSTCIRNMIKIRQNVDNKIPKKVLEYIENNDLYKI